MTFPTWLRKYCRDKYGCFYTDLPKDEPHKMPTVCIIDFMQFLRGVPSHIVTLDHLLNYLLLKIKKALAIPGIQTVIVCVDRSSPIVKALVCHTKRYKEGSKWPTDGGPYLPQNPYDPLPQPFEKFTANYTLIRRELLPLLLNRIMDPDQFKSGRGIMLRPGQTLLLSGFPGRVTCEQKYDAVPWQSASVFSAGNVHKSIALWLTNELPIRPEAEEYDPDLYNRVFIIEHVHPCAEFPNGLLRREEVDEMKNSIGEADLGIVFFEHWYQNQNVMFYINDGDAISILLLYAQERVQGDNHFRNMHWLCLPRKDQPPEYVDINELYVKIQTDPVFIKAGVQHAVLTFVFMVIMAGTDFFKDQFKGIGEDTIVWPVMLQRLDYFSHLVQMPKGMEPSTRTPRPIYMDEDCFRQFVYACYAQKYGPSLRKKRKKEEITIHDVRKRTKTDAKGNPKQDTTYHMPERNAIRTMGRIALWNLLYWKNGIMGEEHGPDPFEEWNGEPYFGFTVTDGKPCVSTHVSARQKPIPERFAQHTYKWKTSKRTRNTDTILTSKKQKRIVENFAI